MSTRIGGGEEYDNKDACTIDKSSWDGKKCCQKDHIKIKITTTLFDRWLYHRERKASSRIMPSSRFTVI
jgi:hypothetical protein